MKRGWLVVVLALTVLTFGCSEEAVDRAKTIAQDTVAESASKTLSGTLGFSDEEKEKIKVYVEGLNVPQETKDAVIEIVYGASVSGGDVLKTVGTDNIIEAVQILLGFLEGRTDPSIQGATQTANTLVLSTLTTFLNAVCGSDTACKEGKSATTEVLEEK